MIKKSIIGISLGIIGFLGLNITYGENIQQIDKMDNQIKIVNKDNNIINDKEKITLKDLKILLNSKIKEYNLSVMMDEFLEFHMKIAGVLFAVLLGILILYELLNKNKKIREYSFFLVFIGMLTFMILILLIFREYNNTLEEITKTADIVKKEVSDECLYNLKESNTLKVGNNIYTTSLSSLVKENNSIIKVNGNNTKNNTGKCIFKGYIKNKSDEEKIIMSLIENDTVRFATYLAFEKKDKNLAKIVCENLEVSNPFCIKKIAE